MKYKYQLKISDPTDVITDYDPKYIVPCIDSDTWKSIETLKKNDSKANLGYHISRNCHGIYINQDHPLFKEIIDFIEDRMENGVEVKLTEQAKGIIDTGDIKVVKEFDRRGRELFYTITPDGRKQRVSKKKLELYGYNVYNIKE